MSFAKTPMPAAVSALLLLLLFFHATDVAASGKFLDSTYTGKVYVGTPPMELKALFDTGSANVVICHGYDKTMSKSIKPGTHPVRIMYGSGPIIGTVFNDVLHLGPKLSLEQDFVQVVSDHTGIFCKADFAVIVGLGYQQIAASGIPTVLENLYDTGRIKEKAFAFARDKKTGKARLFWGSNPKKPELAYIDVVRKGHYMVLMEGIQVGHKCFDGAWPLAAVDTGSSLIIGPEEVVGPINKQLGANELQFGEYHFNSCDDVKDLPKISLHFGGEEFVLWPDEYTLKDDDLCFSGFMKGPQHFWVIGDVFLRNFYVEFNQGKHTVGFGEI